MSDEKFEAPKVLSKSDFSPNQVVAVDKAEEWLNGKDPKLFTLLGPAGTGKTTLAKYIALLADGPVWFLAPTGKAALVMRQAGCVGAQTVHSAIYVPQDRSKVRLAEIERDLAELGADAPEAERKELFRQLKIERENIERPMFSLKSDSDIVHAALVIVDECSMVDKTMGEDLLSFDVPILALGDPAQLPPIRGDGFYMKNKVGHLLTEIHRQAKGSPIIQLATTARLGRRLRLGQYGNCAVVEENTKELALEADQIIVGLNKTRKWVNARVRELRGFSGPPQPGEKLVCGRNNKREPALLNGSLWEVVRCDAGEETCMLTVKPFQLEGPEITCLAHMHWFEGREEQLQWYEKLDANQFDFGYAITAHKSQGSQWPKVLIIDESSVFKHDAAKHLYTAITRAQKQVTVII